MGSSTIPEAAITNIALPVSELSGNHPVAPGLPGGIREDMKIWAAKVKTFSHLDGDSMEVDSPATLPIFATSSNQIAQVDKPALNPPSPRNFMTERRANVGEGDGDATMEDVTVQSGDVSGTQRSGAVIGSIGSEAT